MTLQRRAATLMTALALMLGVAACGEDDSVEPGERGDNPSAVGEPGSDASETGGGGTPAEGVDDQSDEN
jgi:hypothetical protein